MYDRGKTYRPGGTATSSEKALSERLEEALNRFLGTLLFLTLSCTVRPMILTAALLLWWRLG